MKKLLFLLLPLLALNACTDSEPTGTLQLNFKAKIYGQPMLFEDDYAYPGQTELFDVSVLRFLISDIKLRKTTGEWIRVADVADVNFHPANAAVATAGEGTTISLSDIPVGVYDAIDFGLGLTPELDATTPGDWPAGNPLGANGVYYWESWGSYIYTQFSGNYGPTNLFRIHCGGAGAFHRKQTNVTFAVTENTPGNVPFTLHIERIFNDNGEIIDLASTFDTHSSEALNLTAAENWVKAIVQE
jgi:hypothetical protein